MDKDVTIIGAGIVGICCALSLQERGLSVRLIDPGAPGQETSFGNAGVISPWSIIPQAVPGIWKSIPAMLMSRSGPLSVRPSIWPKLIPWGLRFLAQATESKTRKAADAMDMLCHPSVELYRRHLAGTGNEDLIADSWYVHAFRQADKAQLKDLGYVIRAEKGADMELVGRNGLKETVPALSRDFKAAILIKGQARARNPGRLAQVLADKATVRGAEILQDKVTALSNGSDGTWKIKTTRSTLIASRVVLSAGVWSAALLKPLGLNLPLLAERGYHVEFPAALLDTAHSVMDVDAKIVASSMENGLRVAGSSEFAAIDAPADPRKKALLVRQARAMFPDLVSDDVQFWMGQRPSFPDSLPALGPINGKEGLYAAFGHSHYGLMMAPKSGEVVADLIAGTPPNSDLSPYDPLRF